MKKVLIVDDSLSAGRELSKIITSTGEFEVLEQVKNGTEAIRMYQQSRPDIICMDMNMPVMDGLTALRALVGLDKNVKVVMITSLGGVGDKYTEALKLGAKGVISKPFQRDEVFTMLRAI